MIRAPRTRTRRISTGRRPLSAEDARIEARLTSRKYSPGWYAELGRVKWSMGRHEEAVEALASAAKRFTRLDPRSYEAARCRLEAGFILRQDLKRYADAVFHLQKAYEGLKEDGRRQEERIAYNQLIIALTELGRVGEALDGLRKAVEEMDRHLPDQDRFGFCLKDPHRIYRNSADARTLLWAEMSYRMRPQLLFSLARAECLSGRPEAAPGLFASAIREASRNDWLDGCYYAVGAAPHLETRTAEMLLTGVLKRFRDLGGILVDESDLMKACYLLKKAGDLALSRGRYDLLSGFSERIYRLACRLGQHELALSGFRSWVANLPKAERTRARYREILAEGERVVEMAKRSSSPLAGHTYLIMAMTAQKTSDPSGVRRWLSRYRAERRGKADLPERNIALSIEVLLLTERLDHILAVIGNLPFESIIRLPKDIPLSDGIDPRLARFRGGMGNGPVRTGPASGPPAGPKNPPDPSSPGGLPRPRDGNGASGEGGRERRIA